jgi:hypothetical protein
MKKVLTYIFAAVLMTAVIQSASAQTEESRPVSGFNSIGSAGPFDVYVKIDGTESLKISANPEIIKEIETKVEDGRLEIKFKHHNYWNNHNYHNYGPIKIYITAKSISGLANAGSGTIKVDGLVSGPRVDISIAGSGNVYCAVKSGDFHASISGSGSISVEGSANDAHVSIAGSGGMNGRHFKTNTANVSIAGSGNAYLAAEKNISASIIGSGNVVYSGNATSSCSKIGSGRLTKAE